MSRATGASVCQSSLGQCRFVCVRSSRRGANGPGAGVKAVSPKGARRAALTQERQAHYIARSVERAHTGTGLGRRTDVTRDSPGERPRPASETRAGGKPDDLPTGSAATLKPPGLGVGGRTVAGAPRAYAARPCRGSMQAECHARALWSAPAPAQGHSSCSLAHVLSCAVCARLTVERGIPFAGGTGTLFWLLDTLLVWCFVMPYVGLGVVVRCDVVAAGLRSWHRQSVPWMV